MFKIDDTTVYKLRVNMQGPDTAHIQQEALALQLVRAHTSIPVPRVYRVLEDAGCHLIVMDYIEGQRLDKAWPTLSFWQKCNVAWTIRGYIRQLRRIPTNSSTRPGPLGPEPGRCYGLIFDDAEAGPFENVADFFHLVHKSVYGQQSRTDHTQRQYHPESQQFVFTHEDLNTRNIILGTDGKVWLIDWDWSGFYPIYFEYLTMTIAAKKRDMCVPISWLMFIPFMADPFFDEGRRLERFWR